MERRWLSRAAEILLDAVQVLDRHEELVLVRVLQLEVFPLDRAARLLGVLGIQEPHPVEAGDAVVDVDDQLPGLVFEVERGLSARRAPSRPGGGPPDPPEEL